jgi:mycothiol system anti-sigma-R factor
MTCEEAIKKLYEYLDHELDHATSDQVEKHIDICKICCDQLEFEKRMKKIVHESCCGHKAPPILKEKILDRLGASD